MTRGKPGDGDDAVRRDVDALLGRRNRETGGRLDGDPQWGAVGVSVAAHLVHAVLASIASGLAWHGLDGHRVGQYIVAGMTWLAAYAVVVAAEVVIGRLSGRRRRTRPPLRLGELRLR